MNPRIVVGTLKHGFRSKRKIEKDSIQFGITSTYVFMVSVICVLLLYYVWILNVNATK
ncbi:MAG: hypothetical protein H6767_07300 [Candidatus Peribacteria bacterium]|nr:MAG: hypothetical protein H6767_07300 [Candidatus Peribacteria bacterium]